MEPISCFVLGALIIGGAFIALAIIADEQSDQNRSSEMGYKVDQINRKTRQEMDAASERYISQVESKLRNSRRN